MRKVMYSKSKMLDKGLLSVEQTLPQVLYYIFVLLFLGMYDIDDVVYILNIDRNELNEHLINILGEGLVTYSMHEELFNQGGEVF